MSKTVSVIIPTLGRENEVIETVDGLLKQTRMPDEIIIVDQNNPPFKRLDDYLSSVPFVKHIRSNRPGVVFNMNFALTMARGDVAIFVDDDVVPRPDLIARHLANYAIPGLGGVAGRIEQGELSPFPEMIREVGNYHSWTGAVVANYDATTRQKVMFAQGANMSFLREALLQVNGFDLGFEGNSYFFEPDVGMRVLRAGYGMEFDPTAQLKHLMAPAGGCRIHDKSVHTYYFIRNGFRLYRRFSPAVGLPFFVLKSVAYALAKAIYNRNMRIFMRGLTAIWAGLTQDMTVKSNLDEATAETVHEEPKRV